MSKKSSKTSHVLSLLTNRSMDVDVDYQEVGLASDVDVIMQPVILGITMPTTTVIDEPQTVPPQPLPAKASDEPQELSDIIKAQLELLAEKEEAELAATVSALNLEYFDEEDKSMYHYTNVVEDIVKVKVIETMKEMNACTCEKCVSDVIALALNSLPPKYVVTEKGNLFSKLSAYENQYSTDVTAAIVHACLTITEKPRH